MKSESSLNITKEIGNFNMVKLRRFIVVCKLWGICSFFLYFEIICEAVVIFEELSDYDTCICFVSLKISNSNN